MSPNTPRLLDHARDILRRKRCLSQTHEADDARIRRYILFHRKRRLRDIGAPENERTYAVER